MNDQLLIDQYFDGRISAQDQTELGKMIAGDPSIAATFVSASRMTNSLEQHYGEVRDRRATREELARLLAKRDRAPIQWRRPAMAAAAAVLLAGAYALVTSFSPSRPSVAEQPGAPTSIDSNKPHQTRSALNPVAASPNPISGSAVRGNLSRFYLPEIHIDGQGLEDAIAMLGSEIDAIADRHGDAKIRRISNFTLNLDDSNPLRSQPVTLMAKNISAGNALQLLAGQAGLNVTYIENAAELRPRLNASPPLRSRSFDVPGDLVERAEEMIARVTDPTNPLSMLALSPQAGATSFMDQLGDGTAKLKVRASYEDLRSINALISTVQTPYSQNVTMTTKIVDLPAESLELLGAIENSGDRETADYIAAIASSESSDQIISIKSHFIELMKAFNNTEGVNIRTLPKTFANPGSEIVVDSSPRQQLLYTELNLSSAMDGEPLIVNFAPNVVSHNGAIHESDRPVEIKDGTSDQVSFISRFVEVDQEYSENLAASMASSGSTLEVVSDTTTLSDVVISDGDTIEIRREFIVPTEADENADDVSNAISYYELAADVQSNSGVGHGLVPEPRPQFGATFTANLEGETVRVSGTMRLEAAPPKQMLAADRSSGSNLEPWGYRPDDTLMFDWVLDEIPAASPADEIDIDATIAEGETLMIEVDGEEGGKRLVFLTAEKPLPLNLLGRRTRPNTPPSPSGLSRSPSRFRRRRAPRSARN